MNKEVWIGWISSLVEAYNMAIFSFIAPLLAKLLFQESPIFFSYSLIFIGASFFYPAGAIYYGLMGDKKGRQKTCIYSTLGLAIATGLMGLVPSIWGCFLVLTCAQHFFSGGEYHGSIVFSLEHAIQKKSGLMSSLSCLFAVLGLVAANGFATLALKDEMWVRMCFFIGSIGGLISYILKNYCLETPIFRALPQESLKGVNWSAFIKSEWRTIGNVVIVLAFFLVSYSFIFIFLPLVHFASTATFISLIFYGLFLVLAGLIADRIGIQKVMLAGICLFSIAILPLCYFCKDLLFLQMSLTFSACLVIGPIHSWMLHQFEVQNRCRGIFVSSAIAMSIFGGSTVPICLLIFERSSSLMVCSLYPLAIGSMSCLMFYKKTKVIA